MFMKLKLVNYVIPKEFLKSFKIFTKTRNKDQKLFLRYRIKLKEKYFNSIYHIARKFSKDIYESYLLQECRICLLRANKYVCVNRNKQRSKT